MTDRGIIASYLLPLWSNITKPSHISQLKTVKDPDSIRVNDLLINKTITLTLYDILLTFRDTDKKVEFEGDLLNMITKKTNVDLDISPEKIHCLTLQKNCFLTKKLQVKKVLVTNLL